MKFYKRILPLALIMALSIQSTAFAGVSSSSRDFVKNSSGATAQINAERTVLTVEDAAKKAIANSSAIKKMYDTENLSSDTLKKLKIVVHDSLTTQATIAATATLKETELAYALNLESIEATKDNVELSIMSIFSNILTAERSLELYDESLELQRKALDITKLSVSLGLESQVNYDAAKNSYEKAVQERASIQTAIDDAYVSLNQLMGQNLNNKYTLELELTYEPMPAVNLTTHTSKYINQSVSVKAAENAVTIAKYNLDSHRYSDDEYAAETNQLVKQQKELAYANALDDLSNAKKSIEESLITSYNSIKELENSRATKLLEIENAVSELEVLKLKYDLGQVTQLEVEQKELSLKSLQESLRQIEENHTLAVMKFNNPNIIASSSAGSASSGGASSGSGDAGK